MTLLVKHIARKMALRRNRSTVRTGLVPLDKVKRAVVLMNEAEIGGVPTEEEIKAFFRNRGIEITVFRPSSKEIGWIGRIKKDIRTSNNEDLFISLYGQSSFESDYEALCSRASFKVGRYFIKGEVFDLLLNDPPKRGLTQIEAFRAIADILIKIK